MAVTIPTFEEARTILEGLHPGMVISDTMIEISRARIALGLEPLDPTGDDLRDKMLKRLILHENRLDQYEAILQTHEARLDALDGG